MNQIQRKNPNNVDHTKTATMRPIYEQDNGLPQRNAWRSSLRKALSNNYLSKRFSYASNDGYGPNARNDDNIETFHQPSRQYISNAENFNTRHPVQYGNNNGHGFQMGQNDQQDTATVSDLPLNEGSSNNFPNQIRQTNNEKRNKKYGSYATQFEKDHMVVTGRKTAMGGALNMGLIASNTDQLLFIATSNYNNFNALHLTKMSLLGLSLLLQIISLLIIGWIATTGQLHEGNRRKQKRLSAIAMFLGFIITIVNVIITSFTGYDLT